MFDSAPSNTATAADSQLARDPSPTDAWRERVHVGGDLQVRYVDLLEGTYGWYEAYERNLYAERAHLEGIADVQPLHLVSARLRVSGSLGERLGFVLSVNPARSTATARLPLLDDAYVSFRWYAGQEVRIGKLKTTFGYENLEPSTELYMATRSYVSSRLGRGPDLREVGAVATGAVRLPAGVALDYGVTAVNGERQVHDEVEHVLNLWTRIGVTYQSGAVRAWLGGSWASGSQLAYPRLSASSLALIGSRAADSMDFTRWGADAGIDTRWLSVLGESLSVTGDAYSFGGSQIPHTSPSGELVVVPFGPAFRRIHVHGYYVQCIGKTPWAVGPTARYERLVADEDVPWRSRYRYSVGVYGESEGRRLRILAHYERDVTEDNVLAGFYVLTQLVFGR